MYELNLLEGQLTLFVIRIFILLFLGILFTQSSLDKILNWNTNLNWLVAYFSASILRNKVAFLLVAITVLEIFSGLVSVIGIIGILLFNHLLLAKIAICIALLTLICLFTGQRIAKDYLAASALTGYFIVCIVGLYLML